MAENEKIKILEKGNIYFFYRPKVGVEHPEGESQIQRFYLVLSPEGSSRFRLAIMGKKELPDPEISGKQRYWGHISTVKNSPKAIREELGPEKYETKTRGERYIEAARPAGEGVYKIISHGRHTHLAYVLELPQKPSNVQEELNIESEASYIISVKNPSKPSPPGVGLSKGEAQFPKNLTEEFRGRRFSETDPPGFLDYQGAEFVLISASEDIKQELGTEIEKENETENKADIFTDLRLNKKKHPVKPLFEGEWE
ncbi:hypothetical protein CHISP_3161 [Chitinispirillum alkaliphilum]|nr:hypothetical protein CHISP_3161 [Chitinispirillum alkaliphilum]